MQGILAIVFFFQKRLRRRTTVLEVLLKIRLATYTRTNMQLYMCWGKYVKRKQHEL